MAELSYSDQDQIQSAPISGSPPSTPQVDVALAGPLFLPCFRSFLPFLESTD